MKILLLSDLHAVLENDSQNLSNSRLHLDQNGNGEWGNALISYISTLNIKYDLIVCCGDIANKGSKASFLAGWTFLNNLSRTLPNAKLVCVPGNHDHQSRPDLSDPDGFSPKHQLQFCEPPFPFNCHEKNTHFWAWNWVLDDSDPQSNLVLLNTSAYHGFSNESHHGRVALETVDQIEKRLANQSSPKAINILICHHHPQRMEHAHDDYDGQQMSGGQKLLNSLQKVDQGPWLILHGHKHYSCISKASSEGEDPPIVFSAGSASAKYADLIDNQFYSIDIDITKTSENERVIGTFETHQFSVGSGWKPSASTNMPAKSGLGSNINSRTLINRIKALLKNEAFLEETDIKDINDELRYFLPAEFKKFKSRLEKNSLVSDIDEANQFILQVGPANAK
ncbi:MULTISPECIES: metallophosphoesterase [unclassified Vibrio]|uniref:metallophosphoesterase family protein n=1 Tax=unclassified Vibrio TaxID=2614977 RepID=UPI002927909D|nr:MULTISPECIES: metallophosphoesterase [unclassified Vibrio]MDU9593987.1 metallophosphoesterase [Vibrio sp. 2-1-2a]MDU9602927.1 metallophosphoesterase [Vibrio sp. 1-2-3a]